MKKIIKCHSSYLISKTTLITVGLVLLLIIMSFVLSIDIFDNEVINQANKIMNYISSSLFIAKFLTIILAVFTFSYNFLPKNDQYVFLIIPSGIKKYQYFVSKILLLFFFIFIYIIIMVVFFFFFGTIFIKNFYFSYSYLLMFSNLLFIVIIYGLYSILFVQILKNIISPMISFSLMLISEIAFEQSKNTLAKVCYIFFPTYPNNNSFYYGYSHILIMILVLFIINIYIYQMKDM